MAGDLNVSETIVAAVPRAAEEVAAPLAADVRRVVAHRYGRLAVVAGHGDEVQAAIGVEPERLADLDETERLGLSAFRLRESARYRTAKRERPREGEPWDMPGCAQHGRPGAPGAAIASPAAAAEPTSAYLEGSVALGIVIVEGPTAALRFSAAERTKVVAEVQNGLGFYATTNPAAGISFTYEIHVVTLTVPAKANAPDLEALWRDPAMAKLGYSADWDGVDAYVESLRSRLGTRWAYAGFFTKYPVDWFAYAAIGGPRIVLQYANDGWGPDNIDRVFAHETGHIFGCPDEYASSACTCDGSWGRFGVPNGNCENCAPAGGVDCLMKGNVYSLCRFTPSQLGWARGVSGNPVQIQSRFGTKGNFELVAPSAFAGFVAQSRNNDRRPATWGLPTVAAAGSGRIDAVTFVQSNFGNPGNLELIARVGGALQGFWRDSGPAYRWTGPAPIAAGARGTPSLVQGRFGKQGNFELVYPLAAGGIAHMYRDNDKAGHPWSPPDVFGQALGKVDGVSLLASAAGSLEVVARVGAKLHHLTRSGGAWHAPVRVATDATGDPALIQSRFGTPGNYELVYPAAGGGIAYAFRDNGNATPTWSAPVRFSVASGAIDAVSLIQGNYGTPGNLELVARVGGTLQAWWRDSGPLFRWTGPTRVL